MPLKLSASLAFEFPQPSDALLQIEAAPMSDQRILSAHMDIDHPSKLSRVSGEDNVGQRIWISGEGAVRVQYDARIQITREDRVLTGLEAVPFPQLSDAATSYLFDSRYCHPTQYAAFAQNEFGHIANPGERAQAIRDWVANHVEYTIGASDSATTATDTFHSGQGICRDFAHLFVTLARACALPARFAACYAPGVRPQDFHAVAQVYLSDPSAPGEGKWRLVDATGMAQLSQTAIIGVGRDAADVSFLTSFGPMQFHSSEVKVELETAEAEA